MQFFGIPANRTQIFQEASANDGTTILYTVPVGKKLLLIEASLHIITSAPSAGFCNISVRDGSDVHIRDFCAIEIGSSINIVPMNHFEPGWIVEFPAGYDIVVISDTSGLIAEGDIFGFEVNA